MKLLVVTTENSVPPQCFGAQRCLNPASGVVATGREDFRKGGSEPMALSEKQSYSVGRRRMYIFYHRKAKKEIPVNIAISFRARSCSAETLLSCLRRTSHPVLGWDSRQIA